MVHETLHDRIWQLIEQLLSGPLRHTPRLSKLMTSTKWVKRQLSLLRPEKERLIKCSSHAHQVLIKCHEVLRPEKERLIGCLMRKLPYLEALLEG